MSKYGWIRDSRDPRDLMFHDAMPGKIALPAKVDLRPKGPVETYDQGQLGSCTANATAGAVEFALMAEGMPPVVPSRLFIYYNERAIEGTVTEDSGAQIRDGMKTVAQLGACPEAQWPYDIGRFTMQPPAACYVSALHTHVKQYSSVAQNLRLMKTCLALGFPFAFGFQVYDSFESDAVAKTGIVPMPDVNNESQLGGHAVLAVGYDDATGRFIVRNSWGDSWGDKGHFYMPYGYLTNPDLASDMWCVKLVSKK